MYCDPVGAAVAARAKRRMAKAKGRTTIGGATQSDKTVVPMSANEAGSFKISKAVQTKQRMPNWEDKASPAVRAFLQRTVKAVEARGDPITLELALSKAMVSGEQLRELAVARMKAELGAVPGMPPTREAGEVEVPCIMMSVVSAAAGSGEVVFFDSTGPTESLGLEVPPNTVTVVVTPDDGEPYVKIKGEGMPGVDGDGDGDGDAAAETEMMQEDALEHLKHTALIIVDVQNDFVTGTLKVDDAEAIVPKINALRAAVPFGFVCHSQDSHPADHCSFVDNHDGAEAFSTVAIPAPDGSAETVDQVMWPRHCVVGTPGWEFHPDLAIPDTDYIQAKGTNSKVDSYSAFFDNFKGASTGLCGSSDIPFDRIAIVVPHLHAPRKLLVSVCSLDAGHPHACTCRCDRIEIGASGRACSRSARLRTSLWWGSPRTSASGSPRSTPPISASTRSWSTTAPGGWPRTPSPL